MKKRLLGDPETSNKIDPPKRERVVVVRYFSEPFLCSDANINLGWSCVV